MDFIKTIKELIFFIFFIISFSIMGIFFTFIFISMFIQDCLIFIVNKGGGLLCQKKQ